jgi:hypothetical protein
MIGVVPATAYFSATKSYILYADEKNSSNQLDNGQTQIHRTAGLRIDLASKNPVDTFHFLNQSIRIR